MFHILNQHKRSKQRNIFLGFNEFGTQFGKEYTNTIIAYKNKRHNSLGPRNIIKRDMKVWINK